MAVITEESTEQKDPAVAKREEGNKLFVDKKYREAVEVYKEGMDLCKGGSDRSKALANISACYVKLEEWESAAEYASQAISMGMVNEKPLERRAHAYVKLKKYDLAIDDLKAIKEKFPKEAARMEQKIAELEKDRATEADQLKEEVLGKLKNLGDMCLRPFGLSTDSFELTDNGHGGLSVSMKQPNA